MNTDDPNPGPSGKALFPNADLVRAAQRGDGIALNELIDHLAPYVGRICGSIALDRGADATQEALIAVLRGLRSVHDPQALYGWVRTVATREAVRIARGGARAITVESFPDLPDPIDGELGVDIRDTLARLPPEYRAILVLRDLDGLSEREVVAILALPTGTVKSRLHRASAFQKGVAAVSTSNPTAIPWPVAELDPIRRLRVLAAATPGMTVVERVIDASFNEVWSIASDIERELPRLGGGFVTALRIIERDGERLRADVHGPMGIRDEFAIVLRPGWCWMEGRVLSAAMAARSEGTATRFGWCANVRLPGGRLLRPLATHSLDRTLVRLERHVLAARERSRADDG